MFYNTTKPGSLTITKEIEGETEKAAEQAFTVNVRLTDAIGTPWSGSVKVGNATKNVDNGLLTLTMTGNTSQTITDIPAGLNYEVSEPDTLSGWTMDTAKTGTIEANETRTETLTNTYSAKGFVSLGVTKELIGRALTEDEFTFELFRRVDENQEVSLGTATNAADGSVTFADIPYTSEGEHTYIISEREGKDNSVEYDTAPITVTVTVMDEYGNGRLTAEATYRKGDTVLEKPTITNTVRPGTLELGLTVDSPHAEHATKEFEFTVFLTDKLGQPLSGTYPLVDLSGETETPLDETLTVTDGSGTLTLTHGQRVKIGSLPDGASYRIEETAQAGFTYASTGASGEIVAAQTDTAAFTNTYHATGKHFLKAKKTLGGQKLEANQFEFILTDKEGRTIDTAFNDAYGWVTFDAIEFTEDDANKPAEDDANEPTEDDANEPTEDDANEPAEDDAEKNLYRIMERNAMVPGMSYDSTVHEVIITVTDNKDGTLTTTDNRNGEPVEFANAFSDTTSVTVNKVWQDSENALGLRPDSIIVELLRNNVEFKTETLTAADGWTHTFTENAFDEDKNEYVYAIRELPVPGYSSAKATANGVTTITNTVDGVLSLSNTVVAGDEKKEFTFTVKLTQADKPLNAEIYQKQGDTVQTIPPNNSGEITLELKHGESVTFFGLPVGTAYEVTQEPEDGYTTTAERPEGVIQRYVDADADFTNTYEATGSVTFSGAKTLTGRALQAGEFTFLLKEKDGNEYTVANNADGSFAFPISYVYNKDQSDLGEHTYTVTEVNGGKGGVDYDDEKYTITVNVTDKGDGSLILTAKVNGKPVEEVDSLDFANTYTAEGDVTISGKKTLTGRALKANEFTFVLTDSKGNKTEVKNNADGSFAFPIKYEHNDQKHDVGPHTYTVTEKTENLPGGVSHDPIVYHVVVEVTDNGTGGLIAAPTYWVDGRKLEDNEKMVFANTYSASGELVLTATKTVNGKEPHEDQVFTFNLMSVDGDDKETLLRTAQNVKDVVTFEALTYSQADAGKTFTYRVHEAGTGPDYMTYDSTVHEITVKVTDNMDGTLSVTDLDDNPIKRLSFNNTYSATGSVTFSGKKTLTGRDLQPGEFTFVLTNSKGNKVETTNGADGSFAFPTIMYELNSEKDDLGEHKYTVKEVVGGKGGVTYDTAEYQITVTVTDDGKGHLLTTVTDADGNEITSLDFTNAYSASGELQLTASKTVNGVTPRDDEKFTFELVDAEGNVLQTKQNDKDLITFDKLTYTQADVGKTFTYTVREKQDVYPGYTLAKTEYKVTVKVKDNGDGTLTATATHEDMTFDNEYKASGSVTFSGTKILTGRDLTEDDAGKFTFVLTDKTGDKNEQIQTVTNGADGKFAFQTITYDLDDVGKEFKYTVHEESGSLKYMTYDDAVYEITVVVADNKDGTLSVTVDGKPVDEVTGLNFTNNYSAKGTATIRGTKELTGRALTANDEFTFVLEDGTGREIQRVQNGVNGEIDKFAFNGLHYTLADVGKTYTYSVKEIEGDKGGVTYDSTVYHVEVTVADNGDGTLSATPTYFVGGDAQESLIFANTYAAKGTAELEITKELIGRDLTDEEFTFELYKVENEEKIVLDTATNDEYGVVTFKEIEYTNEGEYTYFIREIWDEENSDRTIAYSGEVIEVKVEVTDAATDEEKVGVLTARVTYSDDATITNALNPGALKISKTVVSPHNVHKTETEFTFTVSLKDKLGEEITGMYPLTYGQILEPTPAPSPAQSETPTAEPTPSPDGEVSPAPSDDPGLWLTLDENGMGTLTLKHNETVTINGLPDSTVYTVTEAQVAGFTPQNPVESGAIAAAETAEAAFTNTYSATATLELTAQKTLTGRPLTEGEFTFELKDEAGTVLDTATNDGDGLITFDPIEFTAAHATNGQEITAYKYTISEVDGSVAGMTYDENTYEVTVNVSDDLEGRLTVVEDEDNPTVEFSNTFNDKTTATAVKVWTDNNDAFGLRPDSVTVELLRNGSNTPLYHAVLNEANNWTYTFAELPAFDENGIAYTYDIREVPVPGYSKAEVKTNGTTVNGVTPTSTTITNTVEGALTVSKTVVGGDLTKAFTFNVVLTTADDEPLTADVYLKQNDVSEKKTPDTDGTVSFTLKHDESAMLFGLPIGTNYSVSEVDVKDDGYTPSAPGLENGQVKGAIVENVIAQVAFTNTYEPEGSVAIEGTKSLTGRDLTVGEFAFVLKDNTDRVIRTAMNDAEDKFTFNVDYTLADVGEHTYSVEEVKGTLGGVTYDATEYSVVVTVSDNGDGKLNTAWKSYNNGAERALHFANTYAATGKAELEITKELSGRDLTDEEFTFELFKVENEEEIVLGTAKNDADGKVKFAPIPYTLEDAGKTYTYFIREICDEENRDKTIAYSDEVITATVIVEDAEQDEKKEGVLTARVTYSDDATITNTLNPGALEISKTVVSSHDEHKTQDFTFTVTLTDEDDNPLTGEFGLTVEPTPSASSAPLTLNEKGEGTLYLRDGQSVTINGLPDSTKYTVTETAADYFDKAYTGESSGTIVAAETAEVGFINTYHAEKQHVLTATKKLEGRKLTEGAFTFVLMNEKEELLDTATNDSNGLVIFKPITYTQADAGEKTYLISEVSGEVPGMTYDETVHKVAVVVTDDKKGNLFVKDSLSEKPAVFTNTYSAETNVTAVKTWADNDDAFGLRPDSVTVELLRNDVKLSKAVLTAKDNWTYTFAGMPAFDVDGNDYTYEIREVPVPGYSWAATVDNDVTTITNTMEGVLNISKKVENGDLTKAFTFNVALTKDGKPLTDPVYLKKNGVSEKKTPENGTVTFTLKHGETAMLFGLPIGTEYTVAENAEAGYTQTAPKPEDAQGVIEKDVNAQVAFINTYNATGVWAPTATKTVNGAEPGADHVYEFLLEGEGKKLTAQNNAAGEIVFDALEYGLGDVGKTYTYTMSESTKATEVLMPDASVYTVNVAISDNGNGTLKVDPVITWNGETVNEIVFNNTIHAPLVISNTVVGCETEKPFAMTVHLYDKDEVELTDAYAYTGDYKGQIYEGEISSGESINLRHGESITIHGLLPGMKYSVEQTPYVAFTTTVNENVGYLAKDTLKEEVHKVSFVNTLKTTTFTVEKRWQGGSGVIELTLYANGEKLDPQPENVRMDDLYRYTDLPMYTEEGEFIVYGAKEKYWEGFVTIYSNIEPYQNETSMVYDGGTIINKEIVEPDFRVKKVWNGLDKSEKAPEITLVLYCNGVATDVKTPKPNGSGWYEYYDLPNWVNGERAVYTVQEEHVAGFTTRYELADGTSADYANNGGTIVNSRLPETGDDSRLGLWMALAALSLMGVCVLAQKNRKHSS